MLAASPEVVERAGDAESVSYGMVREWASPIDTEGLTLTEAKAIVRARERAFAASGIANGNGGEGETGQLPRVTERAELLVGGLRGPVLPVAVGGAVLALLLVAAAGSFWADRRSVEVRLLASRGVSPIALGIKALLELALPAAVGAALGWWGARELVTRMGPSPYLDAAAPRQAALAATASLLVALALLTLVAAARCRAALERPVGAGRGWYAAASWELMLVAVAVALFLRLRGQDPIRLQGNVAQVDVPLIFLAGVAVLAARAIIALLRLLRVRVTGWSTASSFGIARAAAARLPSALILLAVALPISALVFSAGLTGEEDRVVAEGLANHQGGTEDGALRVRLEQHQGRVAVRIGCLDLDGLALVDRLQLLAGVLELAMDQADVLLALLLAAVHRTDQQGQPPALCNH